MTVSHPILAADFWPSNASLIADCHELSYIRDSDYVLDLTYGQGTWWSRYRPERLTTNDLDPEADTDYHQDYRYMQFPNSSQDVVVFDPPYVSVGGRKTTNIPEFHARYGLTDAQKTPELLQEYNNQGLDECFRIVRPGGVVITKCKDYISSGEFFAGTHFTLSRALVVADLVDRFEMIGSPGPQSQDSQVHARRNLSTMFIFRRVL